MAIKNSEITHLTVVHEWNESRMRIFHFIHVFLILIYCDTNIEGGFLDISQKKARVLR